MSGRRSEGARQQILDRIRLALTDGPEPTPVQRDYRTSEPTQAAAVDALLELLVDRLVDYRATVYRATQQTAATAIATAVAERGARRLVIPEGFPLQLLSRLEAEQVRDFPTLSAADLDGVDGVLTLSRVAIAETGTMVLDGGAGQGRRALSLVPDYHLCVVSAADVVRGVPEAVARLDGTAQDHTRPLTWISGPSATSDIELQRVEGVHGPRTLAVVLIID
jgi:L-lactate dehydrogenase complex protein LldG